MRDNEVDERKSLITTNYDHVGVYSKYFSTSDGIEAQLECLATCLLCIFSLTS